MSVAISASTATPPGIEDLHQLEKLTGEVTALLEQQASLNSSLSAAMRTLSSYCESRFDTEEDSPLYSDGKDTPWLYERIRRVKDQHQALRRQITTLVNDSAGHAPVSVMLSEFKSRFQSFQRTLENHEREEIQLWQKAYWQDVGTKD